MHFRISHTYNLAFSTARCLALCTENQHAAYSNEMCKTFIAMYFNVTKQLSSYVIARSSFCDSYIYTANV